MKPFTLEWWLGTCINAHAYMSYQLNKNNMEKARRYAKLANYTHDRIIKKYGEKQ